jgi:hypothetical protein
VLDYHRGEHDPKLAYLISTNTHCDLVPRKRTGKVSG